jgi:hypothetical protein
MKHPYEIHQEIEREREKEELKAILNMPKLKPAEIWAIYPNNFYKWRAKYDYPRILNHFSKRLNNFNDWKEEVKLSDNDLIAFGISNCINANPAKDKRKYIVQQEWEKEKLKFISYQNIDGRFYNLGQKPVKHKVISSFTGYIDWCNSKGIRIMDDWRDNEILSRQKSSHPIGFPTDVKVDILDGLELLKIGGIELTADDFGLIKPKYFEFVNANYLSLLGSISTSGLKLVFENSFVDNLTCKNLNLALVEFRNCKIHDSCISSSHLQQWQFISSETTGKADDTDLSFVSIYAGIFNMDFKDCTLHEVHANSISKKDVGLETAYRTFKKMYANQGEDYKAIKYFLLEKHVEREKIKKQILSYQPHGLFAETKVVRIRNKIFHSVKYSLKFLSQWINNFYWGYGRKPFRVVRNSIALIIIFAAIYFFFQAQIKLPLGESNMSIWDSLYYSTVTFTTLGYGDFIPVGQLRLVAAVEAVLGGVSLGFLVGGFSNFKY